MVDKMIPFVTQENGEAVIRGANIIWYTMMVQFVAYFALGLYLWVEHVKKLRRRATRVTLTMSNSEMNGEYEKVL
jgi:hypothetical protein